MGKAGKFTVEREKDNRLLEGSQVSLARPSSTFLLYFLPPPTLALSSVFIDLNVISKLIASGV
jgi:hypothetical protein